MSYFLLEKSTISKVIVILVVALSILVALNSCSQKFYTYDPDNKLLITQIGNMPSEPGKCYARCFIQEQFKTSIYEAFVYTGNDYDSEYVTNKKLTVKSASTKWEKRKADRNCLSDNPNDCLVWCLIAVPEQIETFYEVLDTSSVKEFVIENYEIKEMISEGSISDMKEVICDYDKNPALYAKVQQSLLAKGYGLGLDGANGKMNSTTKAALIRFQRDEGLPFGQLDLETLTALEVDH